MNTPRNGKAIFLFFVLNLYKLLIILLEQCCMCQYRAWMYTPNCRHRYCLLHVGLVNFVAVCIVRANPGRFGNTAVRICLICSATIGSWMAVGQTQDEEPQYDWWSEEKWADDAYMKILKRHLVHQYAPPISSDLKDRKIFQCFISHLSFQCFFKKLFQIFVYPMWVLFLRVGIINTPAPSLSGFVDILVFQSLYLWIKHS
jgi:hypothetical protein